MATGHIRAARAAPPLWLPALLLVLLAAALCAAPAAAKRSPQCKGGCIVAVTRHPQRTCACVKERCDAVTPALGTIDAAVRAATLGVARLNEQAAAARAQQGLPALAASVAAARQSPARNPFLPLAAASEAGGGRGARVSRTAAARAAQRAQQAPVQGDCGFCDRDYNTYSSIAECEADGEAVAAAQRARGDGLRPLAYPSLSQGRIADDGEQAGGAAVLRVTAPGDATVAVQAAGSVSVMATCPWPITAPGGDGVTRTACPVSTVVGCLQCILAV
jgi:hypothetical protein